MPIPINISASRGSAILGLSNWSTPTKIWLEIMEAREPGFCAKHNYEAPIFDEDNPLFRWGHAFESSIIELAADKQGRKIIDREFLFKTGFPESELDELPITCHIDGNYDYASGEHCPTLHEGKTTSAFYYRDNFGEPGTDRVPVDYQIQCQHQMICTGAEKVILSVLVFPNRVDDWEEMGWEIEKTSEDFFYLFRNIDGKTVDTVQCNQWATVLNQMGFFHQYEINTHPELQKLMIAHYQDFWERNILTATPPAPKTYDDIKRLIREPVGTILATEDIERLVSEYRNIKSEISNTGPLAKRADQIKVDILEYMKSAGAVPDDDTGDKWILRDRAGKKIAKYGMEKSGNMVFR